MSMYTQLWIFAQDSGWRVSSIVFPRDTSLGKEFLGERMGVKKGRIWRQKKIQLNHIADKFCLVPAERYFNGKWSTVCQLFYVYMSCLDKMYLFRLNLPKTFQFCRKKFSIYCTTFLVVLFNTWHYISPPPQGKKNLTCTY